MLCIIKEADREGYQKQMGDEIEQYFVDNLLQIDRNVWHDDISFNINFYIV